MGGGSPVSQAQSSIQPTTKPAQEVLSNPIRSSATVEPHIEPPRLPAWSMIPVQGPSPTGKPPPPAPVPVAFSSFCSILSPSVFGNTCLRAASGDGGSLQKTHLILARKLSVIGRSGNRGTSEMTLGDEISKIQNEENSIRQILSK